MKASIHILSRLCSLKRSATTLSSFSKMAVIALSVTLIFSSCKKEPDDNDPVVKPEPPKSTAVYVLNQGSYSGNNATVTMYDLETEVITPDVFKAVNERELGDTGADMFIYGSKAYIITNVSSQLEVVNATTFQSIKQISFIKDEVAQQPSAITGHGSHIYVAAYDGTVTVIDTATLNIEKVINVGRNPDALLAAYGKIWVSNSGGLSFPFNYDNTISVIDPVTLTEVDKIEVGTNPYTLQADAYGDIYVITRGDYGDVKMRLKIIDAASKTVKHTFEDFEAYSFTIKGDTAYVYHHDYVLSKSTIMLINVKTEEMITSNFITDGTEFEAVYGIAVDPTSYDVYICEARGFFQNQGKVHRFGTDGKRKYSFDAGVNPVAVRFLLK
jgi:YVTN family beta-propeller protein